MQEAYLLISLGGLFLAGLAADQIGRLTRLPRVTLLLLLGLVAGGSGLDLLPEQVFEWFEVISIVALTMVAFLLGGELTRSNLIAHGRAIMAISLATVFVTLLIVFAGLSVAGLPSGLALILGAIATATAPAAMTDVIRQSGVQNGFTDTLAGVVAIDDVWGLVVFSFCLVLLGQNNGWVDLLSGAMFDIGGAVLLGAVIGFPAAYLSGRLSPGEPLEAEAMGIVFLTAGLALWFEVSFLIAGMTAGAVIVNTARHHDRAFHEIEHIEWPFMLLFFLLAGARLEIDMLRTLGWTGGFYIALRILARLLGGTLGARFGRVPREEGRWFGLALLPQAGVAIGMALVAGEAFPAWSAEIMALTIASTVVFELLGPPITMTAIRRVARIRENGN